MNFFIRPPLLSRRAKGSKTGRRVHPGPSNGIVTFDHQQHAASHPCSRCHPTEPPVKIAIDQQKSSGPTTCPGCHKKS